MTIDVLWNWWLRWREWRSGRSTASKRLEHLHRERLDQQRHHRTTVRHRRLDGNRERHWSAEATTTLLPTLRPLMTYGQQLAYRAPHGMT
ncbi:hypothetical protein O7632_22785 [Solwaraspora sp. WMMD406]|uniref:hypothetical protein n=1 Tax=Solwaraspora sp. WMMD406 TaxID=3016095 RepID=UPI0024163DAC|nr:hypothetical protein [Solwaraspora sp. WMMD406]MDG4766903.1 hypothetical protein [Solwaraspora sp. WMMD406]